MSYTLVVVIKGGFKMINANNLTNVYNWMLGIVGILILLLVYMVYSCTKDDTKLCNISESNKCVQTEATELDKKDKQ